jgi:hypothetical protein
LKRKQLRLLEFPASKQFLISVVGALREEIAGTKVSEPKALEARNEFIKVGGIQAVDAWTKVLKAVLPTIVQNLPAEEYQVVRSSEHMETVAKVSKGVVAGAQILQSSFEELRKLLKPL